MDGRMLACNIGCAVVGMILMFDARSRRRSSNGVPERVESPQPGRHLVPTRENPAHHHLPSCLQATP